jgi:TolB protein
MNLRRPVVLGLALVAGIACAGSAIAAPLTLPYQLTHSLNYAAAPSPDGKKLVTITVIAGKGQIFVMNVDGSELVQITHDASDYDDPAWSPDGRKIAVTSNTGKEERIVLLDPDGSGLEPLTPASVHAIHATWSSDSKRIVYCSDDDLLPGKNDANVYAIDVETRQVTKLISGGINTYPVWSPDMKKIAWRKIIDNTNSEVFVANADGSDPHNVTKNPAFDGWPAWSPDGKLIAFGSNRNAGYQIFVMDPHGGSVRLVANTDGRATAPRWSPDGRTIYFTNCTAKDYGSDCEVLVARMPA